MVREYSNRLLDLYEEGMFNTDELLRSLVYWMSERDVKEYVIANGYMGFSDLPDGPQDLDEEELDDNAEVPAY